MQYRKHYINTLKDLLEIYVKHLLLINISRCNIDNIIYTLEDQKVY